ncbi:MAG: hypothetical protein GY861_07145 [bacterium]|nr:hypothetical protein [bacterium]
MKDFRGTKYFEAILQLRSPTEAVLDFVENEMSQGKAIVTNEKKLKNGVDLYITSRRYTKKLGEMLQKHFGGEFKVSEKLFSRDRQTSKNVYRLNVFFKPIGVGKGEIAVIDGKLVKVTRLGKIINALNIETGKKESIDYRKCDIKVMEVKKTTVSKIYPKLEILHPETFQSTTVNNPKKLKSGEKVKVVSHKGLWLV